MTPKAAYDDVDYTNIRSAGSGAELRLARTEEEMKLIKAFPSMPIDDWNRTVNRMQDEVMSRAVLLCETEMAEAGWGVAPSPFAFVVFGSAGRGEQTLWSDQDNGLIIGIQGGEKSDNYFRAFGERLSAILEVAGYPPCQGKVMVSNPMWRKSVTGWQQQLTHWRGELEWEDVRYLTIVADMRHITGDRELSTAWRKDLMSRLERTDELEAAILRNTIRHKSALNILGQIITERFGEHAGEFDVKYGLYIPLVNGIRCLALYYGVGESSTLERLSRLYELEAFPRPWLDALKRAFLTALKYRSMTAYSSEDGRLEGSSYLSRDLLKDKTIMRELRENLGAVRQLYRMLQRQSRFAERRRP